VIDFLKQLLGVAVLMALMFGALLAFGYFMATHGPR